MSTLRRTRRNLLGHDKKILCAVPVLWIDLA
nr:MAG TPA: hypothetical protein [Caudoviricetes sp.]